MAEEKPVSDERQPDEAKLRRYLLGRCSPEEAREIDRWIFGEGAQPILDLVEDELIEDYITDELDHSDRPHFDRRLVRSPELAEKVSLSAMLLGRQDVAQGLSWRIAALRRTSMAGRGTPPPSELETHLFFPRTSSIPEAELRGTGRAMRPLSTSAGPSSRTNMGRDEAPYGDETPYAAEPVGSSPASRPVSASGGSSSRTNRKIRIAAGIAAGMLICTALFLRSHGWREGTLSLPRAMHTHGGVGVSPPAVVIYMRLFTTEKQIEDFRSSVLAQAGRKNELPSFVEEYRQVAPDHLLGRWAIVIMFKEESRRDEVEGYVERIKRDGRVDHVDMRGPSGKHP